jgi:polysaccharide pyruvyl transferase WcaK-like protein
VNPGLLRGPVLVVGAYGYGNVGDEAILSGLLNRLAGHSVTVVSRSPAETAAGHGVRSIGIEQAVFALRRHRSVVIGGGGLFGRDMGRIGRLLPAFGLLAIALGKTVTIEGVDVGERLTGVTRATLPRLFRAAASVHVRDRASVAALERLGVRASLQPDLSAWMPPCEPRAGRRLLERSGLDMRRPIVGLALTGVNTQLADDAVEAAAGAMAALPDVQFCFIPMSRHPWVPAHDDRVLARRLAAIRPELVMLDAPLSPDEVLSAIGHLSAMVAMRYHAMLFAHRAGVPLVPITYAEKTDRWLKEHDLRPVLPRAGALGQAIRAALERAPSQPAPLLRASS